MSDSSDEAKASGQLVAIANASGVPASLKSRAAHVLGRLVRGTILFPLFERARENLDTVEGRSRVSMMLAEEVARRAIANPEAMERATERFLGEQVRKQENVEAVGLLALEDLRHLPDDTPANESQDAEVDDDWFNAFVRRAEDASSERMQALFGKVLAGEIRRPGSYSPTTLRFLSELDQETATAVNEAACAVVSDYIVREGDWSTNVRRSLLLEDAGILSGAAGMLSKTYKGGEKGDDCILAMAGGLGLVAFVLPNSMVSIPALILSRLGREVVTLAEQGDARANLLALAEVLKNQPVSKLYLGTVRQAGVGLSVGHDELIYERPADA